MEFATLAPTPIAPRVSDATSAKVWLLTVDSIANNPPAIRCGPDAKVVTVAAASAVATAPVPEKSPPEAALTVVRAPVPAIGPVAVALCRVRTVMPPPALTVPFVVSEVVSDGLTVAIETEAPIAPLPTVTPAESECAVACESVSIVSEPVIVIAAFGPTVADSVGLAVDFATVALSAIPPAWMPTACASAVTVESTQTWMFATLPLAPPIVTEPIEAVVEPLLSTMASARPAATPPS